MSRHSRTQAKAFAPATIANLAVGFDNLGLAIGGLGDIATVTKSNSSGINIVAIDCESYLNANEIKKIPLDAKQNTATAGVFALLRDTNSNFGVEVKIRKGIPLGSGLGGSSASAVAAILATNAILKKPLKKDELLQYALIGEEVASGAKHADNVGPCLFGGVTLTSPDINQIEKLPFPKNLNIVVVHPGFRLDTKQAREVLPKHIMLSEHVKAGRYFANFIQSCYTKNITLMKSSLIDEIVEPARAHLIKGFYDVKENALAAGALGCSISGAGPSIFAIVEKKYTQDVVKTMTQEFEKHGFLSCLSFSGPVLNSGARLIK